jgi:hypothetical protein
MTVIHAATLDTARDLQAIIVKSMDVFGAGYWIPGDDNSAPYWTAPCSYAQAERCLFKAIEEKHGKLVRWYYEGAYELAKPFLPVIADPVVEIPPAPAPVQKKRRSRSITQFHTQSAV